jgi:hypothetical protein
MSPLTDKDRAELDNWVRSEYLTTAKIAAGEPDGDHYDAVMRIALQEASSMTWVRYPGAKIMATTRGVARLAWQGIKRNHPKVLHDEIVALMSTVPAIREFREKYGIVNDIEQKSTQGEPVNCSDPTLSRSSMPSSSPGAELVQQAALT